MKRRVIRQGNGGYTVTLPIDWVRAKNIPHVAEVDIFPTSHGLLISTEKGQEERTITLDVCSHNSTIIRLLLNQTYRRGFNVIRLKYKDSEQYDAIEHVVNTQLVGFEISKIEKNFCTLQNIAEPNSERFDIMLRRLFLQIMDVAENITMDITNNIEYKKGFEARREKIDKLTNYTRRLLMQGNMQSDQAMLLYSIVSKLSLICHGYTYMYHYTTTHNIKLTEKEIAHAHLVCRLLRAHYEAFYKKDLATLASLRIEKEDLWNQNDQLLEEKEGSPVVVSYLRELIRLIQMNAVFMIGYCL
jgi:phosphate uptake regulator